MMSNRRPAATPIIMYAKVGNRPPPPVINGFVSILLVADTLVEVIDADTVCDGVDDGIVSVVVVVDVSIKERIVVVAVVVVDVAVVAVVNGRSIILRRSSRTISRPV